MKLRPYKEILAMAKEKIDETLAPMRANKARKQAELEIAKLDEQMASFELKIFEVCAKKDDIDFEALIKMQDDFALVERRKKQFEKIIDELFPGTK